MLIDKLKDSLDYIPNKCSTCEGTGKWIEFVGFHHDVEHTCNVCKGTGSNPLYKAAELALELAEATYAMMNVSRDAGGDAGPAEITYRGKLAHERVNKVMSVLRKLYKD